MLSFPIAITQTAYTFLIAFVVVATASTIHCRVLSRVFACLPKISGKKAGGLFLLVLILMVAPLQYSYAEKAGQPKKVLILFSQNQKIPASKLFAEKFEKHLEQLSTSNIVVSYEHLEMALYSSDKNYTANLARSLQVKYDAKQPDIIVTYMDSAATFLAQYGEQIFPGVPAILSLDEAEGVTNTKLPPHYKAMISDFDVQTAVSLTLQAQPDTKKIYVVLGDSERDRKTIGDFSRTVAPFAGRVEFIYLNKLPFAQMLETIKGIGGNSVILFFGLLRDAAGRAYISMEVLQEIYREARVPIYGTYAHYIGMGSVGGYMVSREVLAQNVAALAADILRGNIAAHPSIQKTPSAEYIFDWRELKRWGIDENRLPAGSRIEYKTPSVWETYLWHIIAAVILILLEAGLIVQLLSNQYRRKKAEAERLETLQTFEIFFDKSPAAKAIVRFPDRQYVAVNPAWEKLFGYSGEEVLGRTIYNINILKSDVPAVIQFRSKLEKEGHEQAEFDAWRKDGRQIRIIISSATIGFCDHQHTLYTILDVTDQRHMEAEIARLDRLNLVGEMAAGIGHEVRNPLTTVRGYLQMFQNKVKYSEHRNQFDTMIEELDRANTIITEYLSLAKNKVAHLKLGNLNQSLNSLFPLLQADAFYFGQNVDLRTSPIPDIYFDEKELRQMVLNLMRNGFEVTPAGGTVTIMTYQEENSVILAIRDQGSGIPENVVEKIGTPFVTTKENGTGLGLSVCYRIAQRHNAQIDYATGKKGTTFFIKFRVEP